MYQEKSMLVELTIHKWTATKHDKNVSTEVERAHSASNAGRYNKRLIDKAHLAAIEAAASSLRRTHYSMTLPWNDGGQRILPSVLFMEYRAAIDDRKREFMQHVQKFLGLYPQLVQDARTRLSTMYDPQDYPDVSDIGKLFGVTTDISPVPSANDFRVDIAVEAQDEVREQINETVRVRQKAAMQECWSRMKEIVTRIAEQCSKEKGVIRDSLMENALSYTRLLDGLNIGNDPDLADAGRQLRDLIVHPDALRTNPSERKRVADGATAILEMMPWA